MIGIAEVDLIPPGHVVATVRSKQQLQKPLPRSPASFISSRSASVAGASSIMAARADRFVVDPSVMGTNS
jgi:hypothetical protein